MQLVYHSTLELGGTNNYYLYKTSLKTTKWKSRWLETRNKLVFLKSVFHNLVEVWGGFPHLWLCTACARVCPGVPSLRGQGRGPCASPADLGSAGVRPPAAGAQGQQPPNPRGRGVKETFLSALAGATPTRRKAPKEKPGQGHWGREERPPAGTSGGARG